MWIGLVGSPTLDTCDCPPEVLGVDGGHHPPEKYAEGGPTCVRMEVYFLILESMTRLVRKPGFEGFVTGGEKGVDELVEFLAGLSSTKTLVYRAGSEKAKTFADRIKKANERIAKQVDMVVAIYDPRHQKDPSTGGIVGAAIRAGKEVHVWQGRWER